MKPLSVQLQELHDSGDSDQTFEGLAPLALLLEQENTRLLRTLEDVILAAKH
jgi:hypothetical protein